MVYCIAGRIYVADSACSRRAEARLEFNPHQDLGGGGGGGGGGRCEDSDTVERSFASRKSPFPPTVVRYRFRLCFVGSVAPSRLTSSSTTSGLCFSYSRK